MKIISVCGKRGLGDIFVTIAKIIDDIKEDSHLIFYYPTGFEYESKIPILLSEYLPIKHRVTFEITHDFFSVDLRKAIKRFGEEGLGKSWYFSMSNGGLLRPIKTQWEGNLNGPIGLCLNNENTNENYPLPGKWFEPSLNKVLDSLIDEKNYVTFGRMFTIPECIAKLAKCRYVIGVDGAWAHVCNAMRVPYYLSINGYTEKNYYNFFKEHPTLTYIKPEQVFNLCVL